MEPRVFPCVIAGPGADGLYGVAVPVANVNGQGASEAEALTDAAACLQELIDQAARSGEALPHPASDADIQAYREADHRLGAIVVRPTHEVEAATA
jgi:predicted RNase H-like HicB family nuclease